MSERKLRRAKPDSSAPKIKSPPSTATVAWKEGTSGGYIGYTPNSPPSEGGAQMARKSKDDKDDKDEKDTEQAMDASRNGSVSDATESVEDSSGGGVGKLLLLLIVAAILAMVLSKDVRSKVLDMLFGSEEEFDYSSTTMPATDAPVGATAS